ncbi:MAG: phosphatase PAP2 family protein [Patescibacteria group bacterium]
MKKEKVFRIFAFIIYIFGILYLNLSTRGFGIGLIVISMFLGLYILGISKNFLKDWLPFLFGFWAYEYTRGIADDIAKFFGILPNFSIIYNLEKSIFFFLKEIPTIFLQQKFPPEMSSKIFLWILFFFYSSFFWIWAGTALLIWLKKPEFFKNFIVSFLTLSFFGNLIFTIFPTMPPWYASSIGEIAKVDRTMWSKIFPSGRMDFVRFWDGNEFAAFPSHHFGWTFFSALWLTKLFGKRWILSFVFPIMIWFATIYGAEHYFVDGLFGGILAFIFFKTFSKKSLENLDFQKIKNFLKEKFKLN